MFVLALVLSALFAFTHCIIHSLDTQRSLRRNAGGNALNCIGSSDMFTSASASDTVTIEPFAAEYIFGSEKFEIKESVHMPYMRVMKNAE